MAKSNQFRAYDLQRKKEHTIPSTPVKISTSRLARGKWTLKAAKNPTISKTRTGRTRKAKAKAAKKSLQPKRATDLLCLDTENDVCMHCCQMCDEPEVCTYRTQSSYISCANSPLVWKSMLRSVLQRELHSGAVRHQRTWSSRLRSLHKTRRHHQERPISRRVYWLPRANRP